MLRKQQGWLRQVLPGDMLQRRESGGMFRVGDASVEQLRMLTLLDTALLLTLWVCFSWAFGWRATCVGLVFWGTNYFAPFTWTGGGILRQDWLAASVIGIYLWTSADTTVTSTALRVRPSLGSQGVGLVLDGSY